MVISGKRRCGNPVLISKDSVTRLSRIPFDKKAFDEGWLQELIRANPAILPVDDIEPFFSPLVPVGREVPTTVGPIDNLYLNPEGYLTIVETKLWRNPEARREVVGQIIDYAKELSRWDFGQLDRIVRSYGEQYERSNLGVLDRLRKFEEIEEADEQKIIDNMMHNIQRGRFLLLIVGDGIRESVEAMVDFLSQTPQLHFTLALVELQVYELTAGNRDSLLVIPQIVTRTREIVRAVVQVEAKEIKSVTVDMPEISKPRSINEEEFMKALAQSVNSDEVKFAGRIIRDMEARGCDIFWRRSSYVVRLPDPGESGRELTLFVVTKGGTVYTGWLGTQLHTLGIPEDIAIDYARKSAQLFKDCKVHRKYPWQWSKPISLQEFHQAYDAFLPLVEETIDRIRKASETTL